MLAQFGMISDEVHDDLATALDAIKGFGCRQVELQHFDGKTPQGWVFYTGPLWDTAIGQPFTGDVMLSPDAGQPGAELRLDNVTVTAFARELPDV